MPNTDTLKLIADTFDVSIDYLLGHELPVCQSCGMTLNNECDKGSLKNFVLFVIRMEIYSRINNGRND